jgi:DNA polymerase III subunit chi
MVSPTELWFYHLERASVEETLPPLLEKCLERGWRTIVKSGTPDSAQMLDTLLWTYKPNAWLPHGLAVGDRDLDARQPILLANAEEEGLQEPRSAQALFLLDGADWTGVLDLARIFVLFDGRDPAAVNHARSDWRRGKEAGFSPAYWRQSEDGKWTRT